MNNDDLDCSQLAEDAYALKLLQDSIKIVEGKYEVSVLWKQKQPDLTPNFSYALKRDSQIFASKRMTEETFQAVNNIFRDYESKGYIRRVVGPEVDRGLRSGKEERQETNLLVTSITSLMNLFLRGGTASQWDSWDS